MIAFISDEVADALRTESVEDVAKLIGLLSGQTINVDQLTSEAREVVEHFLSNTREATPKRLSWEEFNELLLLFNQNRVGRPFFDFFFLESDLEKDLSTETFDFSELPLAVKRFRGWAMLCFGNFRFAYRRLSEEPDEEKFLQLLSPWQRDTDKEVERLKTRARPLTDMDPDRIPSEDTWLLGYISSTELRSDAITLDALIAETEAGGEESVERANLRSLKEEVMDLSARQLQAKSKGKRNTVRYLTSDFLDVYVATSMRQRWEYQETAHFVHELFEEELRDLGLRWFDPTQSFSDVSADKGLVEGLMLKRAACTIYMAQEIDTLGKDSELAATLAQGKPVIAYVPSIQGDELDTLANELVERSTRYFRRRLLAVQAEGLFDRKDVRQGVCDLLKHLGVDIDPDDLRDEVRRLMELLRAFEIDRRLQVVRSEEVDFRNENEEDMKRLGALLAAVESKTADARAATIKVMHPLGFQVHLESGVANGVLVARSVKECAHLVRGLLCSSLEFDIRLSRHPDTNDEVGTVLHEKTTESRFRVVTKDQCLTNSFWNFYLPAKT